MVGGNDYQRLPAYVMKILKGKSAEYLQKEFPELSKKYWGMHIWARGYCVSIVAYGIVRSCCLIEMF
jgi:REP element-mobilizing transposase RayT